MQQNITTKSLIKLTFSALLFAVIVLFTLILPAEYNIDPTGIGKKIGLTQLAPENVASENIKPLPTSQTKADDDNDEVNDSVIVTVPAGRGVEYKFSMNQYAKMTYQWLSEDGAIYHDLHGEPKGDTTGYFESYTIAKVKEMKGSFTAPFTGSHGWYWKNTTDKSVTIKLTTSGQYQVEGLK